jgi:hypothetical protein
MSTRPERSPIGTTTATSEGDHIRDGDELVRVGRRRRIRHTKPERLRRVRKAPVTVTEVAE